MNDQDIRFNEKDIIKKIFDDRWVRFAFGPQGKISSKNLNLGITEFSEGKVSRAHTHNVDEALFILSGSGKVKINNVVYPVRQNDFLNVPRETEHTIITDDNSRLKIFFVFSDEIVIDY